jgi:hypothetical protein
MASSATTSCDNFPSLLIIQESECSLRHSFIVPRKNSVAESLVLRELPQIKALADPFRQRLLHAFAASPQTTRQVAHCLKENPTKLYHHVETLAQAGLLKLVATRQKRGTIERYYQAAARQFSVDRHVFRHLPRPSKNKAIAPATLFENAFAKALREIRQNVDRKVDAPKESGQRAALLQAGIRATPRQAIAFLKKLRKLCESHARKKKRPQTREPAPGQYRLLFALYPVGDRTRRAWHREKAHRGRPSRLA